MAQTIIRLPISIQLTGNGYTATLNVGAGALPLSFLLDTGSSALAVDRNAYEPGGDSDAKTTKYLMVTNYLSSSFTGGVIETTFSLPDSQSNGTVSLSGVNLGVTYDKRLDPFGKADGILGLAYKALDNAYLMPADTWQNQYTANQVSLGKACDLDPYFDQLADAGLIGRKFSFSTKRSLKSEVQDDADTLNGGTFVLGGGEECEDLYRGEFTKIAVLHEEHYSVNLMTVQVSGQPPITVPPIAPGNPAPSNAIVDSGLSYLYLDQDLYEALVRAFNAFHPGYGDMLVQYAVGGGSGCDQTTIDLGAWPQLTLTFQGSTGAGPLTIDPQDYWQFDSPASGSATAVMCGDNGAMGGQSIFGLPIFSNRYVVFDRTATSGNGIIGFAAQA